MVDLVEGVYIVQVVNSVNSEDLIQAVDQDIHWGVFLIACQVSCDPSDFFLPGIVVLLQSETYDNIE